jgi:hypothetical protein
MNNESSFNHKLHTRISVVTLGGWLPIYLTLFLFNKYSGSLFQNWQGHQGVKKERVNERKQAKSEKRLQRRERNKEFLKQQQAKKPRDKGYRSGGKLDQMYILSCTHQIRANKKVGLLSKGMIGKMVWCDVCGSQREVTAMPYWIK